MITVRQAAFSDLDTVGQLHAQSRKHAYRGIIAQDKLNAIDPLAVTRRWQETFSPDHRLYLAEDDGTPAGFSYVADGWLWAIHVAPAWHGSGVGVALHSAARDGLRELGFRDARLWVVEQNARARRFYEREGWRLSGLTRENEIDGAMTSQLQYVCDLYPAT